jgi:hypothetical protein
MVEPTEKAVALFEKDIHGTTMLAWSYPIFDEELEPILLAVSPKQGSQSLPPLTTYLFIALATQGRHIIGEAGSLRFQQVQTNMALQVSGCQCRCEEIMGNDTDR